MAKNTFHAVRIARHGVTVTYEVYANNEPYLRPGRGTKLGRREAYWLVRMLNYGGVQ